ncbi:MAG: hypothetical protein IJA94_02825 [Bacilli bacterium]|nr:hypothetical protein [Bacilli bacterium]
MKKGYFFVNGRLLDKDTIIEDCYEVELDYKYKYEVENFGVSRDFEHCKYNAINDVMTDFKGNKKIIPNTYVAILEIELRTKDYNSIDEESLLADFDIFQKIEDSDYKLVYSGMFDKDEKFVENFISYK